MKRILSLLLTLTLVVTFFALGQTEVEAATSTCTTNRTVFVHYHRWDGMYDDATIHTWGNGTNGDVGGLTKVETDAFGAVFQICVDDDADAGNGLIMKPFYDVDVWSGDDFTDRDGLDLDANGGKENKSIVLKEEDAFVGFDESGIKHVYVLEGSNDVLYDVPMADDMATIAVIYYDVLEGYGEGWGIHTWNTGTGGSAPDWGTPLPLVGSLGVDGGEVANFRVAFIQINPTDASDTIGFIMHNGDDKAFDGDINLDVSALVAGDFATMFYIAGEDSLRTTFEDFDATVNFFEISSAVALDPSSIEVLLSKDIVMIEDDVELFDPASFVLTDKDDAVVALSQVSYDSTAESNATFTLITEAALSADMAPYTVTFTDAEMVEFEREVVLDTQAPTINILGPTETTLELGDTYSLPNFNATDDVDGEDVFIYTDRVKDGHGTVDTRYAGVYEVVIEATDIFGNVAEETITVTVTDPCDDTAHLDANNNAGFIALLVGLPIAFGAVITLGRKY